MNNTLDISKILDEDKKKEIIDIITQRKRISYDATKSQRKIWDRCNQYYLSYQKKDETVPWKNNIFIPMSFEMVETVVPIVVLSLLSVSPLIGILPEGRDDEGNAPNMEQVIDYQLSQKRAQFKLKFSNFIRDCKIQGTSILKVVPSYIRGNYLYPTFDNVNLQDSFIQPRATSVYSADYCGCTYRKTLQQLLRSYDISEDDYEKIKDTTREISTNGWYKHDTRHSKDITTIEPEVIEYYGYLKIDKEEKVEKQYIATVVNDSVLLRLIENNEKVFDGRKPFIYLPDLPLSNEVYGIGLIEPIFDLQYNINKKENLHEDNIDEIVNTMWGILNNAGVDLSQLVARPNGYIFYDTPEAVTQFKIPYVTGELPMEIERVRNTVRNTLGIQPIIQGALPQRQETAAGMITLMQAASTKFKWDGELKNDLGIEEIGEMMSFYNQKYLKKITVREILGKNKFNWKTFTPAEIIGDFSFRASGSSEEGVGNIQIRRLNFLKYFNLMMALPPQIQKPDGTIVYINYFELIKRMTETMGERSPEKILVEEKPSPAISPEEAQKLLEALKAAGAEEEGLTIEKQREEIAPPITGIVPKKSLRPENVNPISLAKSMSARVTS